MHLGEATKTARTAESADSLASLAQLPIARRFELLCDQSREPLESATRQSRCFPILSDAACFERLTWAVAFNIAGSDEPLGKEATRSDTYLSFRSPQMSSDQLLRDLAAVGGSDSLLTELALSVGCEQRIDWQHPSCREFQADRVRKCFEFVYGRVHPKVIGLLRKRYPRNEDAAESAASEAWARVFRIYWSAAADRRFLGLSQISTLVCTVAMRAAIDDTRKDQSQKKVSIDVSPATMAELRSEVPDPSDNLAGQQAGEIIHAVIAKLNARPALVAEMVLIRGIAAVTVAKKLGITEAAVAQHKKTALDALRKALGSAGFSGD